MKHLKWLTGALALAMLGACSDKDPIYDGNDVAGAQGSNGAVDGYIAVEIRLPQETATRAEDTGAMNDQYADGTAAEYKVENALIALFKGDPNDEKTATFYRAQYLTKPFFTNLPEDDPVSASYIAAIQVQRKPGQDETLYALVILNSNDATTNVTVDKDGNSTFTLAGAPVAVGTKFSDILTRTTTNSFLKSEEGKYSKFFMINAPMSTKKVSEGATADDISYLTDLGNTIYDTPEEAKTNVSGCVYVERAVSKVTCRGLSEDALQLTIFDADGNEIINGEDGWEISATVRYALSNTAKESYVMRNVDFADDEHFSWTYAVNSRPRMIGTVGIPALSDPFHQDSKDLYRTYWCRDPHYSTAMVADDKNVVTEADDFTSIANTLYCKENTFQVQHQNYNSTTLALFEVDLKIENTDDHGKDVNNLYVRDGNTSKIYTSRTSAYADGINRIVHDLNVQNAIKAAAKKQLPDDFSVKDHLNIVIKSQNSEGVENGPGVNYLVVTDVTLKYDAAKEAEYFDSTSAGEFNKTLAATKQTLLDGVNALSDITVYPGCITYYTVPVKHFGDYYTPWDKSKIKGMTTQEVYNGGNDFGTDMTHAENYLGRYGMVRNNWYELNISKIAALGSSVIPDSNLDYADDNNEDKKYFAVEIHILSWAKRLQNIEF